jgi:hypothetical protein
VIRAALKGCLRALLVLVEILAFAYVAGAVVGAFFYGLFSVAGMAP